MPHKDVIPEALGTGTLFDVPVVGMPRHQDGRTGDVFRVRPYPH